MHSHQQGDSKATTLPLLYALAWYACFAAYILLAGGPAARLLQPAANRMLVQCAWCLSLVAMSPAAAASPPGASLPAGQVDGGPASGPADASVPSGPTSAREAGSGPSNPISPPSMSHILKSPAQVGVHVRVQHPTGILAASSGFLALAGMGVRTPDRCNASMWTCHEAMKPA